MGEVAEGGRGSGVKCLFDTNVLLSLLKPLGEVFRSIDQLWRENRFQVVLSEDLFLELSETMLQPRLLRLHRLNRERLEESLRELLRRAHIEVAPKATYPGLRDPKDAIVLAAAEHLRPDLIVTGDKDLLVLHEFQGIPIVSPRQFLDRL